MRSSKPLLPQPFVSGMRLPVVSRFGVLFVLLLLGFSGVGRVLFPFGDEPDFTVRAPRLIEGDHPWWSPYFIFHELFSSLDYISSCEILASPLSLLAKISSITCTESVEQITTRFLLTVIVFSPLIFVTIFRRWTVFLVRTKTNRSNHQAWTLKLDTLALACLLPGMVYYLGVFAEEQLILLLGLLVFVVWGNWLLTVLLLAMTLRVDFGNGIVLATFLVFFAINAVLQKKWGNVWIFIATASQAAFALVVGFAFVQYLSVIPFLTEKADSMYSVLSTSDKVEKYPIILRPVITFMTAIFMTPGFVKVVPLYALFGLLSVYVFRRLNKSAALATNEGHVNHPRYGVPDFNKYYLEFMSAVGTILFFVFLFPTYGNSKYYMFLIPFILHGVLHVVRRTSMLILLVSSNILVFASILFFRNI
jgi:hypothetical protein